MNLRRIHVLVLMLLACLTLMPEAWAQQIPSQTRMNLRPGALPGLLPTAIATPRVARMHLRAGGRFIVQSPFQVARPQPGRPTTPTAPTPNPTGGGNNGGGTIGTPNPTTTPIMVFVVPTQAAYAYHKNMQCRTITAPQVTTAVEMTLTKAKTTLGRDPCKVCNPAPSTPAPK